jgi:hypothetical protein
MAADPSLQDSHYNNLNRGVVVDKLFYIQLLKEEIMISFDTIITAFHFLGDIPHFIGGSVRFGWKNKFSDLDLFISVVDESQKRYILERTGAIRKSLREEAIFYPKGPEIYTLTLNKRTIDIIIYIDDFYSFAQLRREHEKVDKFLADHPEMLQFIRSLRLHHPEMRGAVIYKSIIYAMINQGRLC